MIRRAVGQLAVDDRRPVVSNLLDTVSEILRLSVVLPGPGTPY